MRNLNISGPMGKIEGVLKEPSDSGPSQRGAEKAPIAVIAHPHPLYGGNMENAVVLTTAEAMVASNRAALRFNFRGVGRSAGVHHGSEGEVDDLAAVLSWVAADLPDRPILLAGYSFGAATILRMQKLPSAVSGILLLAPPLSMHDFSSQPLALNRLENVTTAVIYGEVDDLTTPSTRPQLAGLALAFETEISNVGHDLGTASGQTQALRSALDQAIFALTLPSGDKAQ